MAQRCHRVASGERQLGIPTARDRLVRQPILQVLEPLLDPKFPNSSYGFRPGRSAHQAMSTTWFSRPGLVSATVRYAELQPS